MESKKFYVVGLNYKKADVVTRSNFSLSKDKQEQLLLEAKKMNIKSIIILSTCNRIELIGFAEHPFQVLTVPKDIDALMSVGFGMAKLAFASENAFDELKGVNPRLCSKMKVLAEGEETLRLILALPQGFAGYRHRQHC